VVVVVVAVGVTMIDPPICALVTGSHLR